ncbi:MAG: 4Fe-4S dicluster domain-containing protein [Bacteroidales bacterium]|nr:4Fe-4S dicluster domain-containing protein [Bacteroidales bacterium]
MNILYWILGGLTMFWIVSNIYRRIKGKNKIINVIQDKCTGCKRCEKHCRHNVFDFKIEGEKVIAFVQNPSNCTACGDCLMACKFNALELVDK